MQMDHRDKDPELKAPLREIQRANGSVTATSAILRLKQAWRREDCWSRRVCLAAVAPSNLMPVNNGQDCGGATARWKLPAH